MKNNFNFDFVGKVGLFGGLSVVMVLVSIFYLMVHGLNYGIDFAGGTEMQVKFAQNVTIDQVRALVEKQGIKDASIQAFGEGSEFIVRFQVKEGTTDKEINNATTRVVESLKNAITTELAAQTPEIRRVDSVGPQVGAELQRNGFLSIFYSLLVILIYVAFRFDYKYSPGAVISLFHDAVITLALYVFIGKEVNIPVLAALLSLIGYSLNDTIVVFDRIRETEAEYSSKGLSFTINKALNDMLGRTIITAATTFVSALCLYLFADGTVSDIAFVMGVGVLFGTYSSIYVAAPAMIIMEKLKAKA